MKTDVCISRAERGVTIRTATLSDRTDYIKFHLSSATILGVVEEGKNQGVDIEEIVWNERYAMDCIMFVIVENESGKTIGFCEIENISADEPTIGIDIASEYRGKGYGYWAAKAMIEECWKIFSHPYFIWEVRTDNLASKKLAIKLGGELINFRSSLREDVLELLKENGLEIPPDGFEQAIERYKITRPKAL